MYYLFLQSADTLWCFVQMNEDTIVRFSGSRWTILLVSEKVKFIRIFAGNQPSDDDKVRHSLVASENLTNNRP